MKDIRYISLESAARIAQVSQRQARKWAREGILVPSVVYNRDAHRHTFVYSPDDVVALRVIRELRRQFNMPLDSTKEAAHQIQSRNGRPWQEVRFLIAGKKLRPAHAPIDTAIDPDTVLFETAPIAEAVERETQQLSIRNPSSIGKVERRREILGGQPVVKGTRVPVSTITNLAAAGWDIDRIVKADPALVPDDVRGALQLAEEQRRRFLITVADNGIRFDDKPIARIMRNDHT